MLEGVDGKVDMIRAYGMMNGVFEEEKEDKTLNMYGVDVKAPDVFPWKREEEGDTWHYNITTASAIEVSHIFAL